MLEGPSEVFPERRPLCRRRFVGMLAIAGAGAAFYRYPGLWNEAVSRASDFLASIEIPLGAKTARPAEYRAFLKTLELRHLRVATIIEPHFNKRGSVQNVVPPETLWQNIAPALRIVDRMA